MNVYKYGLRKRPLFDQISNSFNFKSKIKYPDRTSKFLRNSHELSNLLDGDGEGLFELEEQQRRQNREIEKQNMIREIAETIRVSTTDIRDALSRIERSNTFDIPSIASGDFYDPNETQDTPGATGSQDTPGATGSKDTPGATGSKDTPGATGSQSFEPPKTKLEIEAYVRPSDFKVPLSFDYWSKLTREQIQSFLKVNFYPQTTLKSFPSKLAAYRAVYAHIDGANYSALNSVDEFKTKYASKNQEEQDKFLAMGATDKSTYDTLVIHAGVKNQKIS